MDEKCQVRLYTTITIYSTYWGNRGESLLFWGTTWPSRTGKSDCQSTLVRAKLWQQKNVPDDDDDGSDDTCLCLRPKSTDWMIDWLKIEGGNASDEASSDFISSCLAILFMRWQHLRYGSKKRKERFAIP